MSDKYSLDKSPPNKLRRTDRAQDDAWIAGFFGRARVGYVASRWDDQPFITPVNFWYDPESHAIYFHTNLTGRLRANMERHPQGCFSASEYGRILPANTALEFSQQYESAAAFGPIRLLTDENEQLRALYGLIRRYFPEMEPGNHYRPITASELKQTAVYALLIESWSGKRNWPRRAKQSPDWPALPEEWLEGKE